MLPALGANNFVETQDKKKCNRNHNPKVKLWGTENKSMKWQNQSRLQGPQRTGRAGTGESMAPALGPCKKGDNDATRINLEAGTRLPKRPDGLI